MRMPRALSAARKTLAASNCGVTVEKPTQPTVASPNSREPKMKDRPPKINSGVTLDGVDKSKPKPKPEGIVALEKIGA